MNSTRKQTLAALCALRAAMRRVRAKNQPGNPIQSKAEEFDLALETACEVFAAMSDTTFKLHLELSEEQQTPRRTIRHHAARFAAILILLMSAIPGFAQLDLTNAKLVPVSVVADFLNVPCHCAATDTFTVAAFPTSYRSDFVASAFEPGDSPRFEIYYAHDQGDFLYLIGTGACRNYSNLIPLPQAGYYFVRYFHEQRPALIEVDARCERITLKAYGKCRLPKAGKGGKRS